MQYHRWQSWQTVRPLGRRSFLSLLVGVVACGTLTALAGCGGSGSDGGNGDDYVRVTTGSGSGSFADSRVGPTAGSVYISSGTTFQIAWPLASSPPPSEFTASLIRYGEARGDADRLSDPQKITVTQVVGSAAWNIQRANGFTLDTDGVYYLQITSPGQPDQLAAYIVASGRSAPLPGSRSISTGGSGTIQNVQISPSAGTAFIPRHTAFRLTWPSGSTPPPQFDVNLVRYKEARGGESRDVSTQKIDINASGTNSWDVSRQDNFDLDAGGVYYLEITAPGENPVRAAYIVSSDR